MALNLVTGGTGLLGNNLARILSRAEEPVRVLVRSESDRSPLRGLHVDAVPGDVRDSDAVADALRGVDHVFHCAGLVGIGRTRPGGFWSVNATGTATVARACRDLGIRMIHVSSVDTLGFGTQARPADESSPPDSRIVAPYVASKRGAEEAVLREVDRGLDAVIVNPGFCLGPWDWKPSSGRLLLEVARGRGRIAPPGGNDFCHAVDVARGIAAAAEKGRTGERYILGGEALSYRAAFQLMAEVTQAKDVLLTAPAWAVRLGGLLGDARTLFLNHEPDLNSASAQLACLPHHFSSRKAEAELGYTNRGAEPAIRDAWNWFKEHRYR
ncbi:MAG TPA: NAD-dependent epimerase/dehydratase family protein [Longimicrobiales bacterium]|jgi:dihydroflavonol-4-reductase